jgi:hypothetical protein
LKKELFGTRRYWCFSLATEKIACNSENNFARGIWIRQHFPRTFSVGVRFETTEWLFFY